ncbi:MAG: L-methionine/branched-chain amino acid transporter, partial [Aeromonas sp.]
ELPLATLISYANGNFVIVYLLSMAAGWVLLPRIGKWLAGLSTLLCLAVLIALGSESGYALLLAALYGIWSLLRRRSKARQSAALMQRSTD